MISPLLANVYLHYVFDLWAEAWRSKIASGEMIFVRDADDLVVGFEQQADAERFLTEFQERLAKFGLEVHPEKTRLIEFGRLARWRRKQRGEGEPVKGLFQHPDVHNDAVAAVRETAQKLKGLENRDIPPGTRLTVRVDAGALTRTD